MRLRALTTAAAGLAAAILLVVAASAQRQAGGAGGGNVQGAPQAGQVEPSGAITGQVVSATTGEPLRKVSLLLRPSGRGGTQATTTSDNSGGFRFDGVVPGSYTLIGDRSGYVRNQYGEDKPGGRVRAFDVTAGGTRSGLLFKMTPHSVIVGRVFDEDGDPLENAQVQVWRYQYPNGERQLSGAGNSSSNDLGEFRVAGLAPGRYYLSAQRSANPLIGRTRFAGSEDVEEDYVATFYPRALEAVNATPLDLVPGSELRGIDIGLVKARLFSISGRVEGMTAALSQPLIPPALAEALGRGGRGGFGGKGKNKGAPGGRAAELAVAAGIDLEQVRAQIQTLSQIGINLIPRGRAAAPAPRVAANVNADGTFQINGVSPGSYYLMAQTRPRADSDLYARLPVDVSGGDLDNVTVRLEPPLNVAGILKPEKEDPNLQPAEVRINFRPAGPAMGRNGRIEIAADGSFATELAPDTYSVEVGGLPEGYYLKTVKMSGREVPDAQVDLSFSGGQIEVVVAGDAGSITGRVENARGDPVGGMQVTAAPASGSSRRDLYKSVSSSDDGTFTLTGLAPGGYILHAWEEVPQNAWMDALFRQPFENRSEDIEVEAGLTGNVTLELIDRAALALAGVQ